MCESALIHQPHQSGIQQAVPAAGVARGDAGPERGAPLLGDAEPAGRHPGGRATQDGDAAGRDKDRVFKVLH